MSEPDDPLDDIVLDPGVLVGVWANGTRVHRGRDEYTLDFLRHVPERSRRILVARTMLPALAAFELRDQLAEQLGSYTDWSMPEDAEDG